VYGLSDCVTYDSQVWHAQLCFTSLQYRGSAAGARTLHWCNYHVTLRLTINIWLPVVYRPTPWQWRQRLTKIGVTIEGRAAPERRGVGLRSGAVAHPQHPGKILNSNIKLCILMHLCVNFYAKLYAVKRYCNQVLLLLRYSLSALFLQRKQVTSQSVLWEACTLSDDAVRGVECGGTCHRLPWRPVNGLF